MNPFELPPIGDPVSVEAPHPERPRRGRMAVVAVVTAGLIGGGIAGISQLASADQPDLAATAAPDEPITAATTSPPDDGDRDESTSDEPASDEPRSDQPSVGRSGEIVLDDGDGDPIVIDLGDLADGDLGRLTECLGFPMFDFGIGDLESGEWTPGELPNLDEFLDEFLDDRPFDLPELDGEWAGGAFDVDGGSVTVAGPDGVSVVDLGESGSVTITKEDGEVTISTDGDATVSQLDELFGDFGTIFDQGAFDEFLDSLPDLGDRVSPTLDELPDVAPVDADAVQACLDEVLGD